MPSTTITGLPDATAPLSGNERVPMDQGGVTVDATTQQIADLVNVPTTPGEVGAAPAAEGVTGGNNHDHSGGDGAPIAYSSLIGRPTLGSAAALDIGTTPGTAAAGNDSRFHSSVTLAASVEDVLGVTGQQITADNPGADRLLFWDASDSKLTHLTLGSNLSITGTTINATGGSGSTDLSYTASTRLLESSSGADVTLPLADGTNAGLMAAAQHTKLAGIATGATANATDAALRDRATHTGTQAASTVSDFNAVSRSQVEATLTAGANVTLTPSGSGATRSIQISATSGGGVTGPEGPQGEQGPQGPIGLTGATGPQGPIGLTGATGPQGEQGPAGPQGEPNSSGVVSDPTGITGATAITNMVSLSQAAYDALPTPRSATTLFFTPDQGSIG